MINKTIDVVHHFKTQVVKVFVPNTELQKILLEFVDAQTAYTKAAADVGTRTAGQLGWFAFKSFGNVRKS